MTQAQATSFAGNVYLGRVQNVLPSMEAAFVDIGKGRNAVLYAGEVNWDAAGLSGKQRSIETALKSGDKVLVQVTKDPIGHKGARLTQQINLPGRFLVYVPGGSMTGISRKLPDTERTRLKDILKKIVPEDAGVIIRTAAEGASRGGAHPRRQPAAPRSGRSSRRRPSRPSNAPTLLYGEPDLAIRVIRDVFNEDFKELVVQGDDAWDTVEAYVAHVSPGAGRRGCPATPARATSSTTCGIDEQLAKALDRKVWLPSGGSLVIDRTEAMTVVDVNTGKFVGSGGNLEQTVTRNNMEAAEEIVRQLRLRDIGGIIVIDFIDMVLESNRDLVLRRLTECLGRDRTKHQVAEVTSLGLVQMTRKRVGQGLLEVVLRALRALPRPRRDRHTDPVDEKRRSGGNAQRRRPVAATRRWHQHAAAAGADGNGRRPGRGETGAEPAADRGRPAPSRCRRAAEADAHGRRRNRGRRGRGQSGEARRPRTPPSRRRQTAASADASRRRPRPAAREDRRRRGRRPPSRRRAAPRAGAGAGGVRSPRRRGRAPAATPVRRAAERAGRGAARAGTAATGRGRPDAPASPEPVPARRGQPGRRAPAAPARRAAARRAPDRADRGRSRDQPERVDAGGAIRAVSTRPIGRSGTLVGLHRHRAGASGAAGSGDRSPSSTRRSLRSARRTQS